jgi:replicative DNA helicase
MILNQKGEPESLIKVKSNLPSLDAAVEGFQGGELIVISGPTKNGKTLFAQSLTANFCKHQYMPLWFTFEVTPFQFLTRFPEPCPLIYLPGKLKAHALPWIEDRIRETFLKYHTRIIFIDHLHYLLDLARTRNPSIEIGQIIRRLKTLAVSENFLIFLLCHTTKGKSDPSISYESIRDSSFISQESDSVLMIRRAPEIGENAARFRVEFHRRTGALEKVIDLVKVDGLLQEAAKLEEKERRDWE